MLRIAFAWPSRSNFDHHRHQDDIRSSSPQTPEYEDILLARFLLREVPQFFEAEEIASRRSIRHTVCLDDLLDRDRLIRVFDERFDDLRLAKTQSFVLLKDGVNGGVTLCTFGGLNVYTC